MDCRMVWQRTQGVEVYLSDSGRMTRDWYFVVGECPKTGEYRGQAGEASCLADARKCIFEPRILEGDTVFTIVRLRAGQWFEDPIGYDSLGFAGEVVEMKLVPGY